MHGDIPVPLIGVVILLLLFSAVASIGLKKMRFPYTIGLVIVGLVLGVLARQLHFLSVFSNVHLTPNIILYILLPTLVFEAAINIDVRLLIRNLVPTLVLAAPGLIVATGITGYLVGTFTPLSMGCAMIFGALISATDPVAVIALFKDVGAPRRLTMLVDGESLFNDATAIVMFDIILALVLSGTALTGATVAGAAVKFVVVFVGGGLVGALIGYAIVRIIDLAGNEPLVEIALTTVIAYAAFIVAQFYLNLSGVMSVVGAGMVVSYCGQSRFNNEVKDYLEKFWSYASFAANSFIFLMLGLTEDYLTDGVGHLVTVFGYSFVAILAVQIARLVVVFGMVPLINWIPGQRRISMAYRKVMFWGGLRGALPIGLAVSLSPSLGAEQRAQIIDFTLAVVMFTLLVQGTTVKMLMEKLGMNDLSLPDKLERLKASVSAKMHAVRRLEFIDSIWEDKPQSSIASMKARYEQEAKAENDEIIRLKDSNQFVQSTSEQILWKLVLNRKREYISGLFDKELISAVTKREMDLTIELVEEDIKKGIIPPYMRTIIPFDLQVGNTAINLLRRFALASNLVKKHDLAIGTFLFQVDLATGAMMNDAQEQIKHFQAIAMATDEAAAKCQTYFDERKRQTSAHLKLLRGDHPEWLNALEEDAIARLALNAQLTTIDELNRSGVLAPINVSYFEETLSAQREMLKKNWIEQTLKGS